MSYNTEAGVTNRANSALLRIQGIIADTHTPSAARLVLIAQVVADEPVLTDPMAGIARRQAAQVRRRRSYP